ncbi:MAG: acyl carrier protein [Polyangiaceae bacterium]
MPVSEDLSREVRRIIAQTVGVPVGQVTMELRLDAGGLGIDSLGLIKLNVSIEERFNIAIPDSVADDPSQLKSVRDVVELVGACVARGGVS